MEWFLLSLALPYPGPNAYGDFPSVSVVFLMLEETVFFYQDAGPNP